jgi:hypothetical protein
VIRPIELLAVLVNHKAPSGPAVIPDGWLLSAAELAGRALAGTVGLHHHELNALPGK